MKQSLLQEFSLRIAGVLSRKTAGRCYLSKVTGFMLLEVLLSVALIAALAVITIPIYQSFQVKNDLELAVGTVSQTLRRAQVFAESVLGDAPWGVFVSSTSITLFQGPSFLSRVTSSDEVFDLPGAIQPSGVQEFVFSKFSGEPQATGTLTLTSSANDSRSVSVMSKGVISY